MRKTRQHLENETQGVEPTNTIKYPEKLSVATLSSRGLLEASKHKQIVQVVHIHQIDLFALQETKVNSS